MRRTPLGAALAALTLLVATSSAHSADVPPRPAYKAAPAAPPLAYYNWTGIYVGAHFGYGWAKPEATDPITGAPVGSVLPRPAGILGGGQIGFNYQIAAFVIGLEADSTWTDVKGSANCFDCGPGGLIPFGHPDWFGSLAMRIGYAFDRLLVFAKTGPYRVHEKFRQTAITGPHCAVPCTGSDTGWGWLIGGGVEYAFARNWSVLAEYDFMDFERNVLTTASNAVGDENVFNVKRTIQVIKLGVNFRFDFGKGKAPVVAKY